MNTVVKNRFKIIFFSAVIIFASLFYYFSPLSYSLQLASALISSNNKFFEEPTTSVWEWRSPSTFSNEEMDDLLEYAEKRGVDYIFISIDEFIDIYEMENTYEREVKYNNFKNKLDYLLKKASQKNIGIYALAGHPIWAEDSHRYITEKLTLFSLGLNKDRSSVQGLLLGIQFDIEPYSLDSYNTDNAPIYLKNLIKSVELVTNIVQDSAQAQNFSVGFALPFWFDEVNEMSPEIYWNGKHASVFYHIADLLSKTPISHVAIMSYRTKYAGINGTVNLALKEIDYIDENDYSTKVFIGQEVTNIGPKTITFFNFNWAKIVNQFKNINDVLKDHVSFAGIIVNDFHTLYENYP